MTIAESERIFGRFGMGRADRIFACAGCTDCSVVCVQIRLLWRAAGGWAVSGTGRFSRGWLLPLAGGRHVPQLRLHGADALAWVGPVSSREQEDLYEH